MAALVIINLEPTGLDTIMLGRTTGITHDNEVVDTGGAGA